MWLITIVVHYIIQPRTDNLPSYPCELRGGKNTIRSISWLEVVKGTPNQGVVCFATYGSFSTLLLCLGCVVLCLLVFWLSVAVHSVFSKMTRLLCVEWDIKPYSLTHSLLSSRQSSLLCLIVMMECELHCVSKKWGTHMWRITVIKIEHYE